MIKAVSLLSGGLDSTLATLIVKNQGIDVTAVTFMTPFGCDASDRSSCSGNALPAAEKFGFPLKMCNLGSAFMDMVRNPRHGYGRNMNPCIDCRILMLREAKSLMDMTGADFLVTGEVVGQRPMSQKKHTLRLIEGEAGVAGLVLRPLSALNMPPTIPEERGLIDRTKLFGMSGRSRRPQMALARELGLTEYPSPAGGCLLTEELYSRRLRRLLEHRADVDFNDLELLRSGRQCWTDTGTWIVIGRDETDNARIETLRREGDRLVLIHGVGSPVAIVRHSGSDDDVRLAASICARYTRLRGETSVEARTPEGGSFMVAPMSAGEAEKRLI